MIGDKYSRRAFLGKVGVSLASTAAGSFGGYTVGENLSPRIPGWAAAKEMINIFEQAEYDWMAAYENRYAKDLEKPVRELEDLLGKNERNSEILQEHYQKMGLLDCDSYEDFRKVLDNSQSYVEAATTVERYRELKHRMELHALNMHDKIEETLPNFFVRIREKINEWDWGEEGTKKARNIYKARLEGLVSVYDVYRDNLAAQTELLELSADDFREAQETILSRVQDYVDDPIGLTSDEIVFYEGIFDLSKRDPSGLMLAESLSDKPLFYCDPRISEPIAEIRGKLEGKIDHLQDIQEICDETIALKEDLRKTKRSEKLSPDLVSRVDSAVSTFEEKNKELKADGIYVEYDKYPELKKKWEIARDGVNTINTNFGYAGAIAGGVAGFVGSLLVNRFLMPSADRIARRALTRENRALRAHASDPEGDDSDLEIDD